MAPSTGWRPTHVCSLTTSAPNAHTHDGAKTRLSPPVVPPHGGAAGDAMDGRRSGQQRSYTLGTLSSTDSIRQPKTLSTCRREGQSRAECLGERRQARGLKGRKGPGTLLPQPCNAAAGAGGLTPAWPLAAVGTGAPWAWTMALEVSLASILPSCQLFLSLESQDRVRGTAGHFQGGDIRKQLLCLQCWANGLTGPGCP